MNQDSPGALDIGPPQRIDDPQDLSWDRDCDVLVVGFGAAGAAAALTAADSGAEVLLIDRFGRGGATARSGGVVYAGGGTPQQRQAGFTDTPEAMAAYLALEVGDAVKPETLQRFCAESRELLAWLEDLGARFDGSAPPPKTSYPRDGVYLYYSGNEPIAGYREKAAPAPRGHRTVDRGLSGKALFRALAEAVAERDIPVLSPCAAQRLVVDHEGRVLGVECRRLPPPAARRHARLIARAEALHLIFGGWADRLRRRAARLEAEAGETVRLRARRGVILSTGGFIMHRAMLLEHAPAYRHNLRLGTGGCEGSGIRLGQSAGAATAQMHRASAWRFINPPTAWATGMVVNQAGERFCNESSYGARLGSLMCEEHAGRAWLILDRQGRRLAIRECLLGGLWSFQSLPALLLMLLAPRAATLSALARRTGLPEATLQATAEAYNQAAAGVREDPLGKDGPVLQPLSEAPYFAIDISATNPRFPCPAITLGGLRVDETSGAVVDAEARPIAGLYAAGRAAVGIASNRYVSGLSLADCFWSGRRAGRAAAQES